MCNRLRNLLRGDQVSTKKMKFFALLLVIMMAFTSLAGCKGKAPQEDPQPQAKTTLVVNYYRYDETYTDWDLWVWPSGKEGNGYAFSEITDYGVKAIITFEESYSRLGFIVRRGGNSWSAKDVTEDRFVDVVNGRAEIWLLEADPKIYTALDQVSKAPRIQAAFLDGKRVITTNLTSPLLLKGSGDEGFVLRAGQNTIPIHSVTDTVVRDPVALGYRIEENQVRFVLQPGKFGFRLAETDLALYVSCAQNDWSGTAADSFAPSEDWRMTWNTANKWWELVKEIGTAHGQFPLGGTFKFTMKNEQGATQWYPDGMGNDIVVQNAMAGKETRFLKLHLAKDIDVTQDFHLDHPDFMGRSVTKRGVLDLPEFYYAGNDLGNTWTPQATSFRVWAPTASQVILALYDQALTGKPAQEIPMDRDINGTWLTKVEGNLKDKFYTYKVTVDGITREAVDPYARAVTTNGFRGQIIDLKETNPAGWLTHQVPAFTRREDAIIYEMHVRDFSIHPDSGMVNKGKYLAFTETGTTGPGGVKTGVDHLVELGITHIHLMPVYDFASINEQVGGYNWGYDPYHYNVPEGSYSTNPEDGKVRIYEFKQMVQSLHNNGIRVVMDVVYNHTYTTGDSIFDKIVPQYFYRTDAMGRYTNGSGCGNEVASERPMVRKFIVDSVTYWAREYKIKGFRFDLMALHDIETMRAVEKALLEIDPTIIIYGEPWQAGGSPLDPALQFVKGAQRGTSISVFNDHIRDSIKGDTDGTVKGFVNGAKGLVPNIKRGVVGSINYGDGIVDFTFHPGESINYVSAHDNLTLWDKITKTNPTDSKADQIKMHKLANTIVFTSQGVAFMHGGVEMLRTKGGDHNSYISGDSVNQIDWERKHIYNHVFAYYQGLITLRRNHPAFRMTTAEQVKRHLEFIDSPDNTVAFWLKDKANGDQWQNIVVIYNPNTTAVEVILPQAGTWNIVVNGEKAGTKTLGTANGKVTVPSLSAYVLWKNN
jgi:pullulanase